MSETTTIRCRCGNRLMEPDPGGALVIKGTRILRLRGQRFEAKCGRCKSWVGLPVGITG